MNRYPMNMTEIYKNQRTPLDQQDCSHIIPCFNQSASPILPENTAPQAHKLHAQFLFSSQNVGTGEDKPSESNKVVQYTPNSRNIHANSFLLTQNPTTPSHLFELHHSATSGLQASTPENNKSLSGTEPACLPSQDSGQVTPIITDR